MPVITTLLHVVMLLLLPPLFVGLVNRTKARFAGRRGPPLLQPYRDLGKLLGKGAVYSRTTTWVFRAGPIVGLAAVLTAGALVPIAGLPAPLRFAGDLIAFAALLGLGRFATVLAAMDTGSSFEGMGASREVTFASLAEPAAFACFLVLAVGTHSLSLSEILGSGLASTWERLGPALVLVAVSFGGLLLVENSRMPVDDPNTHLELTMIHEVMVLDHGGPDLAFILYGAAVKLFLFANVLVRILLPTDLGTPFADAAVSLAGLAAIAVAIGAVESSMARLRLPRVLIFVGGTVVLATIAVAVLFTVGRGR